MLKTEVFPHTQVGLDHYRAVLSHVLFLTQNHRRGKWSGIDGNGIIRRKKRCTGLDSPTSLEKGFAVFFLYSIITIESLRKVFDFLLSFPFPELFYHDQRLR